MLTAIAGMLFLAKTTQPLSQRFLTYMRHLRGTGFGWGGGNYLQLSCEA